MKIKELDEKEMSQINGGSWNPTLINAINSIVNTIYEFGKETGSAIIRLFTGDYCPTN